MSKTFDKIVSLKKKTKKKNMSMFLSWQCLVCPLWAPVGKKVIENPLGCLTFHFEYNLLLTAPSILCKLETVLDSPFK